MTDIPCYPNGERVPGHEPVHVSRDLFDAMGNLRDELASLESDIADTEIAIRACTSPRQLRALRKLVTRWWDQHRAISRFFDIDAYLDRAPNNNGVSP